MRRHRVTPFKAGVLALVVLVVVSYFGFTKANPFSNPFELKAAFRDARNLGPRSAVRIAGVDVGKVTRVESLDESGAAEVTMELSDDVLPIHSDARLEVRPRILLEGNFFVDLRPGSPSAPDVDDGDTIPVSQTGASVTLPEILDTLQSDVRTDLRTLLYELGTKARAPRPSTARSPSSPRRTASRRSRTKRSWAATPIATSRACCAVSSAPPPRWPPTRSR